MFQNIKVDIIYYRTNTDFEMEFNLCGCCRMRLLTDKAAGRKDFIHMLARAVSRSRVIIACGSLFGEEGLITNIAAAIHKPLTVADHTAFGIQSDIPIEIIKGSMPLVTSEGYFGGCIIESGPQTIIMLTENKSIRKTIMATLIHPYIEELSIVSASAARDGGTAESTASHPFTPVTNVPQVPPIIPTTDLPVQDSSAATDESAAEETAANAETPALQSEETDSSDMILSHTVSDSSAFENLPQTVKDNSAPFVLQDGESEKPRKNAYDEPAAQDIPFVLQSEETENQEKSAYQAPDTRDIPFVFSNEEPDKSPQTAMPEANPDDINLFIEPQRVKYSKKNYYSETYGASSNAVLYYGDDDNTKKRRTPSAHSGYLPLIILGAVLLVIIALLLYLLVFLPMQSDQTFAQYYDRIFAASEATIAQLHL